MDVRENVNHALAYQKLFAESQVSATTTLIPLGCWKPPKRGYVKLNVDGVLFFCLQVIGIGAILRDSKGDLLLAASIKECGIQDPKTIELVTLLRGLQVCIHLSFPQILIEFNYQMVVQAIQDTNFTNSLLGNLLNDIREMMDRLHALFDSAIDKAIQLLTN